MSDCISNLVWLDADGVEIEFEKILFHISEYTSCGKKIFVGSDSMLYSKKCIFVTAICLHDNERRRSNYFYNRTKRDTKSCKNLRTRILKEVQSSIDVGIALSEYFENAEIEIHVDVGKTKRSATKPMGSSLTGWISSLGFEVKLKPESWASSSVADWHTKRKQSKPRRHSQ